MKKLLFIFTFFVQLFLLSGCSGQATIGTKSHSFAEKAKHIVWLQIEGLSPEHLAMTGFSNDKTNGPISSFSCLGLMWNYNLYKLRPTATEGFMAQTLGSRNIKRSCSDIDRDPVWSYFQNVGYEVGLFSSQKGSAKEFSYEQCEQYKNMTQKAWVWKREKNKTDAPFFHFQEEMLTPNPSVMYDKSCQQKSCGISFVDHAFKAWKAFSKDNSRTFFVVRDQLYRKNLQRGNLEQAKKRLIEVLSLLDMIKKESQKISVSFVVSTSGSLKLDMPKQGTPWKKMVNGIGRTGHRSSSLNSYVWAKGPGAENFCGSFNESEMLKRFLWLPDGNFVEDFVLK